MKVRLHLATGNGHKVAEFAALAASSGGKTGPARDTEIEYVFVRSDRMPEVVEDTGTFAGNARKKARALKDVLSADAWVLADDSGICVDALEGAPGVESAYFAGPEANWEANLQKLLTSMREVPDGRRTAHFYCLLVLLGPRGFEKLFEGRCNGVVTAAPSGVRGFGYDPVFMPDGHHCTYAELGPEEKNRISHRANAWQKLHDWARGGNWAALA